MEVRELSQTSQPKMSAIGRPCHKMLEFAQIYFSDKMTLNELSRIKYFAHFYSRH